MLANPGFEIIGYATEAVRGPHYPGCSLVNEFRSRLRNGKRLPARPVLGRRPPLFEDVPFVEQDILERVTNRSTPELPILATGDAVTDNPVTLRPMYRETDLQQ